VNFVQAGGVMLIDAMRASNMSAPDTKNVECLQHGHVLVIDQAMFE
jgi:hypothetical protein